MIAVKDLESEEDYLVFATKQGIVKRSSLSNSPVLTKTVKLQLTLKKMMN